MNTKLLFFVTLFFARLAAASPSVAVAATSLFVPTGFDDNDEVIVALDGYLPNACFQVGSPQVKLDLRHGEILVQAMAHVESGPCPKVPNPFLVEAHLGQLPVGTYTVRTPDGALKHPLLIEKAHTAWRDDQLYVPVDSISLERPGNLYVAVIEGRYTDTCLQLKEIRVTKTGHTIQVMPIMELLERDTSGHACQRLERPFRLTKTLPSVAPGRYLLHVRSLNGRGINLAFTATKLDGP